jgi:hypothetical protein
MNASDQMIKLDVLEHITWILLFVTLRFRHSDFISKVGINRVAESSVVGL